MPTLTPEPLYPAPNRPLSVRFALVEPTATFVRVWCTDAPAGSKLKTDLTKSQQSRLQVYEGDGDSAWTNGTFDKGGAYRFTAQEYKLLAENYGGSYESDPDGAPTQTQVGAETDLVLFVGQRMACPLGFGRDTATLVLYVWDGMIRPTTVNVQGELTPIIVNPQTARATSAVATSAVIEALDDLKNVAAATATGTLAAALLAFVTAFNAHLGQATVHQSNDTDNDIAASFTTAPTPQTLPRVISELLSKFRRHISNDSGTGIESAGYHDVSGVGVDWTNTPLFTSGGSLAESFAAVADLYRAYEAHRVSVAVHENADGTNVLADPSPLLIVHREFIKAIAALSPTVPPTQSSGAVLLTQQAGFTES